MRGGIPQRSWLKVLRDVFQSRSQGLNALSLHPEKSCFRVREFPLGQARKCFLGMTFEGIHFQWIKATLW